MLRPVSLLPSLRPDPPILSVPLPRPLHPTSSARLHSATSLSSAAPLHARRRIAIARSSSVVAEAVPDEMPPLPEDSLSYARAFWVTRSIIAWNTGVEDVSVHLYTSKSASLRIYKNEIEDYDEKIPLELEKCGLPLDVCQKFPHISSYSAFRVPDYADLVRLMKCQLAVASFNDNEKCRKATGIQLPGVLDDLFSYSGPLGAVFGDATVSLFLWAPTAQSVQLHVYEDHLAVDPLKSTDLKETNGVWNVSVPSTWEGFYYVYELSVYHPSSLQIETYTVNDPYARGISPDGKRTLLVNIEKDYLKPDAWDNLVNEKPTLRSLTDISIYELHVRDFSALDYTVDPDFQGGYLAFTCQDSDGVRHLRRLSKAGITHVHLLPCFHFGGVDDDKNNWKEIDHSKLESFPPDSEQQQAAVTIVQNEDGYNWGYNPILWGVPKGSYSSNPVGPCRTLEFRQMVQALNRIGFRVILDVVYNHVNGSGPYNIDSVLDKVVPGYYLRRNTDGHIENSTCLNNTASEHFMMERIIVDDLLFWAVQYKVDGFRFDLMGHIMKSTMIRARHALRNLSKEKDGVDGSKIFLYGEGWDFGEVANSKRGVNASQFNILGTGIGSFNDRIRDAVLGGSPFGHPLQQGFVTGLSLQPNDHYHGDDSVLESMLAAHADHIQVGLAANLRDFVLTGHDGAAVRGFDICSHGGTRVGYASCPEETINYVSAHDNETLFDIVSLKTSMGISVKERCRINSLATSIVALSQGIPFFHAGDEILRSKSLDRDSYNSGDWFNRLDLSYNSNNWAVGLPPKEKNERIWPLIKQRLADPSFKPSKRHILATLQNFEDFLAIRYSSPLFRLKSAATIQERVRFLNTGPSWIPGLIVMSIEDGHEGSPGMSQLDPVYSHIIVLFNARPTNTSITISSLRGRAFQLHPIQVNSADDLVKESAYTSSSGSFYVPHRTTSVFVQVRGTS